MWQVRTQNAGHKRQARLHEILIGTKEIATGRRRVQKKQFWELAGHEAKQRRCSSFGGRPSHRARYRSWSQQWSWCGQGCRLRLRAIVDCGEECLLPPGGRTRECAAGRPLILRPPFQQKEALGCWAAGLPAGWASSANEKQTPRVEECKKWGPKMPARRQAEFSEYQAVSLGWWQVIQKRQNIKLKKGKLKTINYQKIQCELKNKNTKARGRDTQRTSGRTYRRTVGEVNTAGENETQETTESTRLDKYGLFESVVGRKSPLSEQNMAAQIRKTG